MEHRIYPPARVAFLRHLGVHAGRVDLWDRVAHCFERAGVPRAAARFGICVDDTASVPPERCRYDACVEVPPSFQPVAGMRLTMLPGGRYDCLRFVGSELEFASAWATYLASWLPSNRHRHDACRAAIEVYPMDAMDGGDSATLRVDLCLPTRS